MSCLGIVDLEASLILDIILAFGIQLNKNILQLKRKIYPLPYALQIFKMVEYHFQMTMSKSLMIELGSSFTSL
ncbi:hypothetical protein CR513_06096, partial [Mucuna pruriens]